MYEIHKYFVSTKFQFVNVTTGGRYSYFWALK